MSEAWQGSRPLDARGPDTRLVEVLGLAEDRSSVLCTDEFGKDYQIPLGIARVSRTPTPGEVWIIDRAFGGWTFAGWVESTEQALAERAGKISLFATSAVPPSYLVCNGSEVPREQYLALYEAVGDSFGSPTTDNAAPTVVTSQSFSLTGSALTGDALAATPAGYVGASFTLTSSLSFASGETDVVFFAVEASGAKLRSVSGTPPLWKIYEPTQRLTVQQDKNVTLFMLVAQRGALTNSQPTFVVDLPQTSLNPQRVAVVHRHRLKNVPASSWVDQSALPNNAGYFSGSSATSSQGQSKMTLNTVTGNTANSFAFGAVVHAGHRSDDSPLAISGATQITTSSNLSALASTGVVSGLSLTTFASRHEESGEIPPTRLYSAERPGKIANWAACGLVSSVPDGVKQKFRLPSIAAPVSGTSYAISTGVR